MRPSRALTPTIATTALAVVLAGLAALPAGADPVPQASLPMDEIVGEETVTTAELEVDGVDEDALDTLELPELPVDAEDDAGEPVAPEVDPEDVAVLTDTEATGDYDVLGITWDDPAAAVSRVLVRTRTDGEWSDWTELEIEDDGPDPGTAEAAGARPGTAPLVAAGSDGVQVRLEAPDGTEPEGVQVTLVDGGTEQDAAAVQSAWSAVPAVASVVSDTVPIAAPTGSPTADSLRPAIVRRSQWGADESIRKPIAWNDTIKNVVVHHTVNANDYSRDQAPAIVRSIYAYHVLGRGWSDVGYHFLVDRFGTVYEGRKGSMAAVPLGVHTGGFNTDSIGISAIGDYRDVAPSAAMVSSIARVAAWKLGTYGRDPLGTTTVTAGSGSTRQTPGWTGAINTISGHKDLGLTACPGQRLYERLGDIREQAAALMVPLAPVVKTDAAALGDDVLVSHYAGRETVSWSATVRSVCTGDVVRTITGRGSRMEYVRWDVRDDDGDPAPTGLYTVTVDRTLPSGSFRDRADVEVLAPDGTSVGCGYTRYGGQTRYDTAVALARAAYPDSDAVVLAAGAQESIVDGLVAGPFARSIEAPVLLTAKAGLPAATKAEIARRAPSTVWLIGGTGVISKDVSRELFAMGVTTVTRLWGASRYDTSAAVARQMGTSAGVVLASGAQDHLIDTASSAGAAAAVGEPILLVNGDALRDSTRAALVELAPTRITVVGGRSAVSLAVSRDAVATAGVAARRFGGATRYDTAIAVADGYGSEVDTAKVMVASGADDHLIDAATAGALGRVTLLVPGETSAPSVETWLSGSDVAEMGVAGGRHAVATLALAAVVAAAD